MMDTTGMSEAIKGALDSRTEVVTEEYLTRANLLWQEVRTKTPAPKKATTDSGVVVGQELVEHMNRQAGNESLSWNYEIMLNCSGITPADAPRAQIPIGQLSADSKNAIQDIDVFVSRRVNRRYLDAETRIAR